jgi:hypothetical protein
LLAFKLKEFDLAITILVAIAQAANSSLDRCSVFVGVTLSFAVIREVVIYCIFSPPLQVLDNCVKMSLWTTGKNFI